jgi:hypothetical protein
MEWSVNKLCPLNWSDVFPCGIPGVEFEAPKAPRLSSRLRGIPAESWMAAGDRSAAAAAYRLIFDRMAGKCLPDAPMVAVCARFMTARHPNPESLAAAIPAGLSVFVLADSHRDFLARRISEAGGDPVLPKCPELPGEQVRTPEAIRLFMGDWKTMLLASLIVATPNPTSILHPAMAAGIPIIFA